MFPGFLASASVILHLFFVQDPVKRRLGCNICALICKRRNDLTGRHTGEALLIHGVNDKLTLFRRQLVLRLRVFSTMTPVIKGPILFIKFLPPVVSPFCDPEPFTCLVESGTAADCFVNKPDSFTTICGAY